MARDSAHRPGRSERRRSELCAHALAVVLALLVLLAPSRLCAATPWRLTPDPAWPDRIDLDLARESAPAGASSGAGGREYLLLQKDVRTVGSAVEEYTHWAQRISNESVLQAASMLSWEVDPTFERLEIHYVVVHRGPERLDRFRRDNVRVTSSQERLGDSMFQSSQTVAVVLDDIRVGDVIEAAFTVRGEDPSLGGKVSFATAIDSTDPVARMHVRVSVPAGLGAGWRLHRPSWMTDEPQPTSVHTAAGEELTWDRLDLPGEVQEADVPSWYTPLPWVQVSGFGSWTEVAEWGMRLYGPAVQASPDVEALADAWRASARSDRDVIERAMRFVQDDVRYVGVEVGMGRRKPSPSSQVLQRRYGDCKDKSVLLTALLRSAGIPASPALVSTSSGPILDEMLPSPTVFDHVIVRVGPIDGATYWVDPTVRSEGGGIGRHRFATYGRALVLREGTSDLEEIPEPPADDASLTITEVYQVTLPGAAQQVELDATRVYSSTLADVTRARLQTQTSDEVDKYYLRLYTSRFPRIEQRAPMETQDDRAHDEVRVTGHYRVPDFWESQPEAGVKRAELSPEFVEELLRRPGAVRRKAPLAFSHPLSVRHEMFLDLPTDWSVEPSADAASSPAFLFEHTSRYGQRRLALTWSVESKRAVVEPAEYAAHLAAVDEARGHLVQWLTYAPVPPDGPNWYAIIVGAAAAVLLGYGSWRAYRWAPSIEEQSRHGDSTLAGMSFGIFLLALRTYSSPLTFTAQLWQLRWVFSRTRWSTFVANAGEAHAAWPVLVAAEGVALAALTVYSLVTAAAYFGRKRSFKSHFTALSGGYVLWTLAPTALEESILGNAGAREPSLMVLAGVVMSVLFVVYVRTSPRVAARFVRP